MLSKLRSLSPNIFLFFIVATFSAFGWYHLSRFETADEHYWISERIPRYWQAIENGQYKKTLINDKPGISLALASGIAVPFFSDTVYYEPPSRTQDGEPKQLDPETSQRLFLAFRLPILVINAFLLLYFFGAIKALFRSRAIALVGTFFIGLSPTLIGISQIVNPDALLWSFGFAASLSFLLFLEKNSLRHAILTALFFSLALLSKYTAMMLVPLFFAYTIFHSFFRKSGGDHREGGGQLLKNIGSLGGMLISAVAITAILLPAILMKPRYLADLMMSFSPSMPYVLSGSVLVAVIAVIIDMRFIDALRPFLRKTLHVSGKTVLFIPFSILLFLAVIRPIQDLSVFSRIPFDIKNVGSATQGADIIELILLEYNPLAFSLPPIVLGLLLFTLGKYVFSTRISGKRFSLMVMLASPLLILPLGYLVSDTVATVRYLIILYPFASLIAAIGGVEIFAWLQKKRFSITAVSAAIIVVVATFMNTLAAAPFYLTYTSPILPKSSIVTDAWGYGGYEAAQYINNRSIDADPIVWSDYAGVCPFIQGICITDIKFDTKKYPIDYYVITRRGSINVQPNHSRWVKPGNIHYAPIYAERNPAWQLLIDGRPDNFIKVIESE